MKQYRLPASITIARIKETLRKNVTITVFTQHDYETWKSWEASMALQKDKTNATIILEGGEQA